MLELLIAINTAKLVTGIIGAIMTASAAAKAQAAKAEAARAKWLAVAALILAATALALHFF